MPAARVVIALKLSALAALVAAAVLWPAPTGGPGGGGAAHAQTWPLLRTFLSPTSASTDQFGSSVAAVGSHVLVGAYVDDTGAGNAGAAYLFDTAGALLQTFPNPIPESGDQFGWSVAAVGGNALVGAPNDDTSATDAGAAYLFDGNTGTLLRTFLNPTPESGDQFGFSVAALGGNVLVGAHLDDTAATDAGAAYLFNAGNGALLRTFLSPTPAAQDFFGYSVAGVGANVLVGAPGRNFNVGAAYLFSASNGALLQTFLNPTPATGERFGGSVAELMGSVVVGAPTNGTGSGDPAVYLFNATTGVLLETFLDPNDSFSLFGWSVAALGANVLVGDIGDFGQAAYLFNGATGALLQTFINPTPDVRANFGWSVAAVGGNVVVGDTGYVLGSGTGAAHLFCSTETCPLGVGGVAELPDAATTPVAAPASSGTGGAVLAGIAAAAAGAIALGGAAWWGRRRVGAASGAD